MTLSDGTPRQPKTPTPHHTLHADVADLRWLADAYDQAQRTRIENGERLRALLQQRDTSLTSTLPVSDADSILKLIRTGKCEAPSRLLGWTYQRHWEEEQALRRAMKEALAAHPAWPWFSTVRGVGPTLACKLLGRLDIHRAPNASSFWAYCGLATVPGVEYTCTGCGIRLSFPVGRTVSGRHVIRGTSRQCGDRLVPVRNGCDGVRVAQPRPVRGESMRYDPFAKKTCYLMGISIIRSGGPYAERYRGWREMLTQTRADWPPARRHMGALRRLQKAVLADLWSAWRSAIIAA